MFEAQCVSSLAQVVVGRIWLFAGCWQEASLSSLLSGFSMGALPLWQLASLEHQLKGKREYYVQPAPERGLHRVGMPADRTHWRPFQKAAHHSPSSALSSSCLSHMHDTPSQELQKSYRIMASAQSLEFCHLSKLQARLFGCSSLTTAPRAFQWIFSLCNTSASSLLFTLERKRLRYSDPCGVLCRKSNPDLELVCKYCRVGGYCL